MAYKLVDVLQTDPSMRLVKVQIQTVDTTKKLATVTYNGATITRVAYQDHYVPVALDWAEAAILPGRGMLIMGKRTLVAAPPEPTITPVVAAINLWSVYNDETGEWSTPNPAPFGAGQRLALKYPASFGTSLSGKTITAFTIEIQPVADSWIVFELLGPGTSATVPGSYMALDQFYAPRVLAGGLQAINLPVGWADVFGLGQASGIGIHSDLYEGQLDMNVVNQGRLTASYTT